MILPLGVHVKKKEKQMKKERNTRDMSINKLLPISVLENKFLKKIPSHDFGH